MQKNQFLHTLYIEKACKFLVNMFHFIYFLFLFVVNLFVESSIRVKAFADCGQRAKRDWIYRCFAMSAGSLDLPSSRVRPSDVTEWKQTFRAARNVHDISCFVTGKQLDGFEPVISTQILSVSSGLIFHKTPCALNVYALIVSTQR